MKSIQKNWKTTAAGLIIAGVAVAKSFGWINDDVAHSIMVLAGAAGLIASKDGNVTGGTVTQDTVANPPVK